MQLFYSLAQQARVTWLMGKLLKLNILWSQCFSTCGCDIMTNLIDGLSQRWLTVSYP